jgi:cytochrome c
VDEEGGARAADAVEVCRGANLSPTEALGYGPIRGARGMMWTLTPPRAGKKRSEIMITRPSTLLSAALLIAAFACGTATAAEFATKEEAIAIVKKAVAFIREAGPDKAFAEFNKTGGRFHDRDLYITVLDLDGKVLSHGQRVDLIGKVQVDLKDPDGKLFVRERVELARRHSSFWQNYKFMNPLTKGEEPKEMYCEVLNATMVCSGVYRS